MADTTSEDAVRFADLAISAIESVVGTVPATSPIRQDRELLWEYHQSFLAGDTYGGMGLSDADFRLRLRRQSGAIEVLKRIVGLEQNGSLADYAGSLSHFKDAGVSLSSPFTDYGLMTEIEKDHTRKLLEFYVAAGTRLNSGCRTEVADEKDNSQQNPDVLITGYEIDAVACKVTSSKTAKALARNVMKGADQVRASGVRRGIVAVDVRHRVDEEVLMKAIIGGGFLTFPNRALANDAITQMVHAVCEDLKKELTASEVADYLRFTGSDSVILVAQGLAIVNENGGKAPVNVNKAVTCGLSQDFGKLTKEGELATWIITTPDVQLPAPPATP